MSNTLKDDPDYDSMNVKPVKRTPKPYVDPCYFYDDFSDADPGL